MPAFEDAHVALGGRDASELDCESKDQRINDLVGIAKAKGIRLKQFERVVANLLTRVQPAYSKMPMHQVETSNLERNDDVDGADSPCWPFNELQATARVYGNLPGQLKSWKRARKKEQQLHSMMRCIFSLLPDHVNNKQGGAHVRAIGGVQRQSPLSQADEATTRPNTTNLDDHTSSKQPTHPHASPGYTIVDFGGGSGSLGIPLALLLPTARIIVVDLGEHSLKLCHVKASHCNRDVNLDVASESNHRHAPPLRKTKVDITLEKETLQPCEGISNLFTYFGPLQSFANIHFDMGIALHLCGEATDAAFRLAGEQKTSALVFAPCCVGKTSVFAKNPYVWQATGSNIPSITYPQSQLFCQLLAKQDTGAVQKQDAVDKKNNDQQSAKASIQDDAITDTPWEQDWAALAKAADYSQLEECRTSRNAARRTAKALLETDRRLFLEEQYGYRTALTRMEPWEATPKNDILLAWRDEDGQVSHHLPSDDECQADIQLTVDHLLRPAASSGGTVDLNSIDWTAQEEGEIRKRLEDFKIENPPESDSVFVFPTRMGGRKRKLIHFVAASLELAHWSHGDKDSQKTVAVSRRGRRRRLQQQEGTCE